MPVTQTAWGSVDGQAAHRYRITNRSGASIVVSDYGATALEMTIPAPDGTLADIILGYDTVDDYRAAPTYFGATAGRFANRIRRGRFTLDGKPFQVPCNEGLNALHGGPRGFDKHLWAAELLPSGDGVVFTMTSPDGDQGFPGTLSVSSGYRLTDNTVLRIDIRATTDAPTLCNIVHHSYFNLAGTGDVLGQELSIAADFFTPVDDELVITGEVLRVDGTPFDFRAPRAIGAAMDRLPRNAGAGRLEDDGVGGYDHNWCIRGEAGRLRPAVTARDPASGRGFELWTTEPGVHFYTGGYLDSSMTGKGGRPLTKFGGFTLETQRFPDGPNLSHVPQSRLDPGEAYHHVMEFRFFT
jgi:aldose 1-epimerase